MAQRMGDQLTEKVPHVDYVLGTDRQFELPDVIEGREGSLPVNTAFGHEKMDSILPVKETPYNAFVTISRGCDNYCTYCIVPYVRGSERAHSVKHIIDSVNRLAEEGVVEVTLLGQNVNSYQYEDIDFPELLTLVARQTDIGRIRFMTSHPKDLSRRLVDVMGAEPKVMNHIHLPLQSGSNRVLGAMGRDYTIEHYLDIIEYIRSNLDSVSITTDLLVGFPSETEDEYEETLKAVREVRYDSAFMFRYSVREGTAAAGMKDDVPEVEKIRRLQRLIKLQKEIGYEVNQQEVGRVRHALVEGPSRRSDKVLRARTEGNKIVLFQAGGIPVGSVVPVCIKSADAFTLHGELTERE
jgi:tRNA-2-methylthio-N6-dimethylallyladenosine synthase